MAVKNKHLHILLILRAILEFQRGQRMEQDEHLFPLAVNIHLIGLPKDACNTGLLMTRKEYTDVENIGLQ